MGTEDSAEQTPEQRRALFRVVRGTPDQHELAALTAVVAAAAGAGAPAPAPAPANLWSHPASQLRVPLVAGRGAWRASGLPR
ncbi:MULTISPECIES: acyl-CoA carboxylase epsilon subunit [Pseudonocardia]|uniref:Acyl-CoA carboxylase subunit epsilon n=2 Tax=Pseudonocardia TaxID=1847 RepID=A0A1Y2MR38_PSEAH|nr:MULTISPECIES: acyl-CoA carboxylase epsilon subunit [Pseudonocardia]OSY37601.1 hypothetical protein BG845_04638 [Pseudonocardia autotrophica]TDN73723.1 acyl-CoA carboxylase epsilon subunit-like protein [Pseudonocardia autotrophica]BBG04466.1 acetyl-CoA carboxylase biotin carboxyl carrier protein subunit [Pseudonocardia autotrophica]GEC27288.1 acetyl-CoA carboxylase biotin carboxyl carrier protein subunit [Pseudonocardia saturnea]